VLLVEDIELNVIVARSVLEKLGNSVDVAMTGKAALEMFAGRVRPGAAGYSATGYDRAGYLPSS
jgi:CheY-like chemotaxis protein